MRKVRKSKYIRCSVKCMQRIAYSGQRIEDSTDLTANRYTLYAKKAFTLLELMVATSILGLIGLAVLTTFGSGLHVYERVQSYGGLQADILLSLEEMERDLANTFPLSGIEFEGEAQKITFPAVIETIETIDEEERAVPSIGQIAYSLGGDDDQKVLMRDQWDYSQAVSGDKSENDQSGFFAYVKDIRFSYYFLDGKNEEYGWKESWSAEEDEGSPVAVKIELTYEDRGRDITLVRTVFLPSEMIVEETEEDDEGEEGGDEDEEPRTHSIG